MKRARFAGHWHCQRGLPAHVMSYAKAFGAYDVNVATTTRFLSRPGIYQENGNLLSSHSPTPLLPFIVRWKCCWVVKFLLGISLQLLL
jgi:hypothetical protein